MSGMAPQRIQRTREKGWKAPAGAVYVGRPTKWGNPIPASEPFTAEDSVRMFRELVIFGEAWWTTDAGTRWEQRNRFTALRTPVPTVEAIRSELAGKNLMCWCPLSEPCHADVLLKIANGGAQ